MKLSHRFILLFFMMCTFNSFAQQDKLELIPFLKGNKYGFANIDKKLVIPAKYDFAYPFLPGYELTLVIADKTPSLINRKGLKVFKIPMGFIKRAVFNDFDKMIPQNPEVIDLQKRSGVETCPPFNVYGKIEHRNLFDKVGNYYIVTDLKKYFLIDEKGKKKSEDYDKIRHIAYGEYEYCITEDSTLRKKGLLNKEGALLLNCTYDDIIYQGKGIFKITDGNISHDYKVVLEKNDQEKEIELVKHNLQIKRKNGKTGVVDSLGSTIIAFEYDRLYSLIEDKFLFIKGFQTGIINSLQEIIFSCIPDSGITLKSKGQPAIPYLTFSDSLTFFNIANQWQLVDINGNINQARYNCIAVDYQKLASGVAGVDFNGKIGVLGKNGILIIPAVYDEIFCLSESGTYLARTDKKWTWLNSEARVIYDNFDNYSYFIANHLFVLKNGNWYFIDKEGSVFYQN